MRKFKKQLLTFNFPNCASRLFFIRIAKQSGYTLIEMLVVIAMASILMGTTLYNYSRQRSNDVVLFETQKLAQYIRRAQNLALSPQLEAGPVNGFGIYVSRALNTVTLFKDLNSNYLYDGGSEKIESFDLDQKVIVTGLQAPDSNPFPDESELNILYIPPDPTLRIFNNSTDTGASIGKITIAFAADTSKTRVINFNSVGLVEVQ